MLMLCAILDVRGCLVIAKFSATNRESRKLENSEKKAQSPQMQLCGQATASLPGAWPGWPAQPGLLSPVSLSWSANINSKKNSVTIKNSKKCKTTHIFYSPLF